ncbi:l-gluamine-d-fructose-6-phosphate aminotransferase [Vibrio phage vB_ValP_IME271]|nr:l-gluamine-d-fructose-6-phosphate aminotransferase [Vibrio phage vB_ValP_IME271]
MKKIADIFKLKRPRNDDSFGVELELEYNNRPAASDEWKMEHDGSLRVAGIEYVMKEPMSLADSKVALQNLSDKFKAVKNHPKATNLASSHIHINVSHMTLQEFIQFVSLVLLFEPHIGKHGGQDRWMNYFAVSSQESGILIRELLKVRTEEQFAKFILRVNQRDWRYNGINFASVAKYGSLEIRYLGAMPEPLDVIPWLEFYDTLREAAMNDIQWGMVFETVSAGETFLLEGTFKTPFPLNQDDLLLGARMAQDLVYPVYHDAKGAPFAETWKLTNYYANV